jgi:ZIP family zinc transporter
MPESVLVVMLALGAGAAMPAGALFARFDQLHPAWLSSEWRHFIVAFGGGALISAIALVLVPDGVAKLSTPAAGLCFAAGGVTFFLLDIVLNRLKSAAGQLVAMLTDFIPEAIALGAAFAAGENTGLLLAFLIALQNLPEGFNAFEELARSARLAQGAIIAAFCAMALLGPAAGLAGYFWLGQYPAIMGALMLFASGGILYLVFDDIAPQAKLDNTWMPALGAVAGFLLGLIGSMLAG